MEHVLLCFVLPCLQAYLRQEADVHLHVAALAASIQPLHVHVQRPVENSGQDQDMYALEQM